ncbi:MAG: hypothetical protein FWD15_03400 [Alphaproteobacteria bacterium]|nr:hypothetical protein [Alphaproteobacteria bacterium]
MRLLSSISAFLLFALGAGASVLDNPWERRYDNNPEMLERMRARQVEQWCPFDEEYLMKNNMTCAYGRVVRRDAPAAAQPEPSFDELYDDPFVENYYVEQRNVRRAALLNDTDWRRGIKDVYWENYRGNNIRIEVLQSNTDMRYIRLKFTRTNNIIADSNADIATQMNAVAQSVMRRSCGQRAKQAIVYYDRPILEGYRRMLGDGLRPVPGATVREYAYRCVY